MVNDQSGRSLSSTEEAAMSGDSHEVLAPRRSHCCDCHREFWGRSVRCPDCYAAAVTEAETCACGGGTVGLVQREGDKVTRHHAQICGWEQDAGSSTSGCCPTCKGTGYSGDPQTNGHCWDCQGTGCADLDRSCTSGRTPSPPTCDGCGHHQLHHSILSGAAMSPCMWSGCGCPRYLYVPTNAGAEVRDV